MKQVAIAIAVALGLGMFSPATYAGSYFVNGHAASPAEVQLLVSYGAQPGHWRVDGYGISSDDDAHAQPVSEKSGEKCRYVLDVLLCD